MNGIFCSIYPETFALLSLLIILVPTFDIIIIDIVSTPKKTWNVNNEVHEKAKKLSLNVDSIQQIFNAEPHPYALYPLCLRKYVGGDLLEQLWWKSAGNHGILVEIRVRSSQEMPNNEHMTDKDIEFAMQQYFLRRRLDLQISIKNGLR